MPPKKRGNSTFLLDPIDIPALLLTYGIAPITAPEPNVTQPDFTPLVGGLRSSLSTANLLDADGGVSNATHTTMSLGDVSRHMAITMMDAMTGKSLITDCCYWCRHTFDTVAIGCPLRYVPNAVQKMCQSEVTKEVYAVRQSVPSTVHIPTSSPLTLQHNDYYETDGVFCSFNCCLAFINDNVHNPLYTQSTTLLMQMYARTHALTSADRLVPAPHWRLLDVYGGNLTLADFRANFNRHSYVDLGISISHVPKIMPTGMIFEQLFIF